MAPETGLPPVSVQRIVLDGPAVVRVDPAGQPAWIMSPQYAREVAALLIGAALAVETLNDLEAGHG